MHAGYPDCEGAAAGRAGRPGAEVEALMQRGATKSAARNGAWEIRLAQSDAGARCWSGRGARRLSRPMGRISPNYIVQDGVIPRTALPQILHEIEPLSAEAGLRVANVFHAGDGNLHPLVLYDRRIDGQEDRRRAALRRASCELCVCAGGSITGEHGVGRGEKEGVMSEMFAEPDLATMQRVRCAFDPEHLANPEKIFPRPRLCGETRATRTSPHPSRAGIAEIF